MISIVRTDSGNVDFIELVKQLDADLAARDGKDHLFYAAYNTISAIKHTVVAFENDLPIACGAMKEYIAGVMEIKRMYTLPQARGKGFAGLILTELEQWAAEEGYQRCVLETGRRQPEAIALYSKSGYKIVPNYGQYIGIDNSICFEKVIT